MDKTGRVLDFTYHERGHSYTLNWDGDRGLYSGFVLSAEGVERGDVMKIEGQDLLVTESTWCGDPQDMYHIDARVVK